MLQEFLINWVCKTCMHTKVYKCCNNNKIKVVFPDVRILDIIQATKKEGNIYLILHPERQCNSLHKLLMKAVKKCYKYREDPFNTYVFISYVKE